MVAPVIVDVERHSPRIHHNPRTPEQAAGLCRRGRCTRCVMGFDWQREGDGECRSCHVIRAKCFPFEAAAVDRRLACAGEECGETSSPPHSLTHSLYLINPHHPIPSSPSFTSKSHTHTHTLTIYLQLAVPTIRTFEPNHEPTTRTAAIGRGLRVGRHGHPRGRPGKDQVGHQDVVSPSLPTPT